MYLYLVQIIEYRLPLIMLDLHRVQDLARVIEFIQFVLGISDLQIRNIWYPNYLMNRS